MSTKKEITPADILPPAENKPVRPAGEWNSSRIVVKGNERDVEVKQHESVSESSALNDREIDHSKVRVLPGTGGPDDVGDTEAEPDDYNRTGH